MTIWTIHIARIIRIMIETILSNHHFLQFIQSDQVQLYSILETIPSKS